MVPVCETASARQVAHVLAGTTPRLALAGGAEHRTTLAEADPALPLWTMDAGPDDLAALAASGADVDLGEVERRRLLATPDDVATIVHTSGTSGRQKAARIR